MSNLARRDGGQEYLQLSLFRTEDPKATNYAALYDLAPRHVVYKERGAKYLEAVRRTFRFGGQLYQIVLSPARIVNADGTETEEFPGEREQLVEDVIRNHTKVSLGSQDVQTQFTMYEIIKELSRLNHQLTRREVRDALIILNRSNIEISVVDDPDDPEPKRKKKPLLSAPAFPVLGMSDGTDDNAVSFVQLNPLLTQAIRTLKFTQVNYEWMMRLKSAFARWAFKRLSIQMLSEDEAVLRGGYIELSAAELAEGWGQTNLQFRDTLRKVSTVIEKLEASGVIESFHKKDVFRNRTKIDARYTVKLSESFIADRLKAIEMRDYNEETAKRIGTKGTDFVAIDTAEATRISHQRRTAAIAAPR